MRGRLKSSTSKNRLSIVLMSLAVLPALAVGLVSHNFMFGYLRLDGLGEVRQIAELKHHQLATVLARTSDRARSFLSDLSTQCGSRGVKANRVCAANLIRPYLALEGALGATLRRQGSADLVIGTSAIRNEDDWKFHAGQLAKFSRVGPENNHTYFVIAGVAAAGLQFAVTYPSSSLQAVFDSPSEVGDTVESFLTDAEGYFVSKARYPSAKEPGQQAHAYPRQACSNGNNGEVIDQDYRGTESILGFSLVPEMGAGCVVAKIDRAEVFAPLAKVRREVSAILLLFLIPVILAALYIARRISETDDALQGALSLNQNILMTSATGFAAYRQDGQCVMVNPAFSKTVGGTEGQLLSQNFHNLASWQKSGLLDWAISVLATGLDVKHEIQLTTTFGRRLWLHCHLSRFIAQGEPHLLLMFHDITEERQATLALKESEEFNRRIIASSSDCIEVLDLDGNLVSMSQAGQQLLEIAENGHYLGGSWLDFWQERDKAAVSRAIAAARCGGPGRFVAYCPTERGLPKWWDVVITPIVSVSGKIERLLAVSRDVTDRKEEEEQFKVMIRTSLDGFWITDERGRFLEVNDAYCQLIGYSRAEMLDRGIPDVEAIESPDDTARHIHELMEVGNLRFETRHRCKNGGILDIEVSANHTPLYGGRIYCFLRDITERKYAERLQQQQRNFLEEEVNRRTVELTRAHDAIEGSFREIDDLYQNAPCGYHSLDRDGRVVRINDTELRMLGYTRDEIIGKKMQDMLTSESLARFGEEFSRLKEEGQIYGVETELIRKDGSILPALINASVIRSYYGQFVMSRATVYDMTEHKKANQVQLRLNRTLRLLSEANAVLVHAQDEPGLLDSICRLVVETGGYLMAWVGFAEQDAEKSVRPVAQFGYDDGYLSSIDIRWADTERGQGPTAKAIRLGATQVNQDWESNLSLRPWLGAAKKRGYQSSIALPISCEKRALGALSIYSADTNAFVPEEIQLLEELANNLAFGIEALRVRAREEEANNELETHRLHLEELVAQRTAELSAAKIEAEKANNGKSRFLAAASHDLRQPLSALRLYIGVLKNKLDAEEKELLMNMQECVGGLSNLLSKLLDLSKLDAGVVKPSVRNFALDDMLARVVAAHTPDAESKSLSLRYGYFGLTVRTDPILFQRIVGNLVANAIRYTQRGGVLIGCRRRHGKMWIEIWDTGIGIPEDKIGEIFEEFKQLGDDTRTYGSGLGLTIVAKTAELLGLRIRVQSRTNRGSMFAIELPIGKRARTIHPKSKSIIQGVRVAVVDDNLIVRNALVRGLENSGHEVVAAGTGRDLLTQLNFLSPEIMVCDYRLAAGETGFDVISSVRTTFGRDVPAVIITGDTDPKLMRSMAKKGITILHKPVDIEDLQELIEGAMSRSSVTA